MSTSVALIGDVGGTNTRLALSESGRYGSIRRYANACAAGIDELIANYLAERGLPAQGLALWLAVAAPVEGDEATLTNLDWSLSARRLRERFGFIGANLVNDFAAIASALPALGGDDVVAIGEGAAFAGAPYAVLGPGTGLGAAVWVPHSGGGLALATEAGHATLAATSDAEAALIAVLRAQFGHVSAERVLSGPGLVTLYAALAQLAGTIGAVTHPAEVIARAERGDDAIAAAALDQFFALLGNVAGNLALTTGARGGIYLAGGILPRLVDALRRSRFRACFENKGRFGSYLRAIPTRLIVHPEPGLAGLARRAAARLD